MSKSIALVVRGGWPGHLPEQQTDALIPYIESLGFDVVVSDDPETYADDVLLASTALIVQSISMGQVSDAALTGLMSAVEAGTGFAGWHGGIVDSFRTSAAYLQLTGGQFAAHPGGIIDFEVVVSSDHPIVEGIDRFAVTIEQYWVLTDSLNTVLAETTIASTAETPWRSPVTVPAVWTRQWGAGRVFVSTIGHAPSELDIPEVRAIVERGLLWASRL